MKLNNKELTFDKSIYTNLGIASFPTSVTRYHDDKKYLFNS
jgi:hypothetical protein